MTSLTTCVDAEAAANRAAAEIARRLQSARRERGGAHLALSGGSTPARTYELLASELERWEGIELWFADERCLLPDDEESNYRLAKETLLASAAGLAENGVHRMLGELGPELGAERYEGELREHAPKPDPIAAGGPPQLDVIVLGIGPDGHVASLFPGAPTLDADPGRAVPRRARLAQAAAAADHLDAAGSARRPSLPAAGHRSQQGGCGQRDARGAEPPRTRQPAPARAPQRDRRRRRRARSAAALSDPGASPGREPRRERSQRKPQSGSLAS